MEFLQKILPSKGKYCVARKLDKGFAHSFFDTVEDAYRYAIQEDVKGGTIYLAQASFLTDINRKGENVSSLRTFFIDLDCGEEKFSRDPEKSYPSQKDGVRALVEFCTATQLPLPSIVSSGNGLYPYWLIVEDMTVAQWRGIARVLKELYSFYKFRIDPSRATDISSVLRPIGTHNRKNGESKPVELLKISEQIHFQQFASMVKIAAKLAKIDVDRLEPPKQFTGLNDEFMSGVEGPPSSLHAVASKCAQIRRVKDSLGDIDEPSWYNFIGMARYTHEAKEDTRIIHEWSSGHPHYDSNLTEAKIRQHEKTGMGPTTCLKFGQDYPSGCIGCPHNGKVKSPIVLGREAPEEIELDEDDDDRELLDFTPHGFRRTKDGIFFGDDAGETRIYPYDMYLTKCCYDASVGYEVTTIKHLIPVLNTYREFNVRSALLHDPKSLLMALSDNHVHVSGKENKGKVVLYVEAFLDKIKAKKGLSNLNSQFGWREDAGILSFVLGDKIITEEGVQTAGLARNIPQAGRCFVESGDKDKWVNLTKALALPELEPMAFAFLAGVFGAPLLRFVGYPGAMVALVGDSGVGKTMTGEWIMSAYGEPSKTILRADDTQNFLVQRLGLYGSIPIYVDEVSNADPKELSDLVYKITQGRDKGRLNRSGQEREIINHWNTLAVVSSNHSLIDKLTSLKIDASAELNRLIEIPCPRNVSFNREVTSRIYDTFRSNYGHAGIEYIQYLVENQTQHKAKIMAIVEKLDTETKAKPEERYWSIIAAVSIYGGLIATKLGLIKFPVPPVMKWIQEHIKSMRATKYDLVVSQEDYIGQFLDNFANGILICRKLNYREYSVVKEPRGPVVARIELDTNHLYISRSALKLWLERVYGSYSRLKDSLGQDKSLLDPNCRKVLGSGTIYATTQQPSWWLDMNAGALRNKIDIESFVEDKEERGKILQFKAAA